MIDAERIKKLCYRGLTLASLALLAAAATAQQTVYRCAEEDGSTTFSDSPCSESPEIQHFQRYKSKPRRQLNFNRGHIRPASSVVEVSHDDVFFIIDGTRFEARTFCFDIEIGDQVLFLEGNALGACGFAEVLNLRTNESCELWCD